MNLKYLGDALDHWKGAIFESLQTARLLMDFAVDPMSTDSDMWAPADFLIYARLLRVHNTQVLRHKMTLRNRKDYFTEITHMGDLFLDPDTGVSTSTLNTQYVMPYEIGQQLDRSAGRLLIVYQHIRAQKCDARIDNVVSAIRSRVGQFSWCSYESPTVALLFMSRNNARVQPLVSYFEDTLGRHARSRVRGAHLRAFANSPSA